MYLKTQPMCYCKIEAHSSVVLNETIVRQLNATMAVKVKPCMSF